MRTVSMKARWLRHFLLGLVGVVVIAVGLSIFTATTATTSFSYTVTDLGTLGGSESRAFGVNDAGQVVGWAKTNSGDSHAFLWEKGTMKRLGGDVSSASDINNRGQVVGGRNAALWSNGTLQYLGTLTDKNNYKYYSYANGINYRGQVVGNTYRDYGFREPYHGFMWVNGTIRDLNSLISTNSGWELSEARDINNKGQIVGYGKLNGQTRAFLLTPTWVTN